MVKFEPMNPAPPVTATFVMVVILRAEGLIYGNLNILATSISNYRIEKVGASVNQRDKDENLDQGVIDSFGHEWASFDYAKTENKQALDNQFAAYCAPINLSQFNPNASIACDFGAGSGRWSERLLPYFSHVYALEPSDGAHKVLKTKFANEPKIEILRETVGANSVMVNSLDLAISLGVLHHIPDTGLAIKDVSRSIKPGGYFLCYLYYNLENKNVLYKLLFELSNLVRLVVCKMPPGLKRFSCDAMAVIFYMPFILTGRLLNFGGFKKLAKKIPLSDYTDKTFFIVRNDSLDRFGTRLEQRFSRQEVIDLMEKSGLEDIVVSPSSPYYHAIGRKK